MIKWKRPSGTMIETNEEKATIEHCEAQKWKRMEPEEENEGVGTLKTDPKPMSRFGKKKG